MTLPKAIETLSFHAKHGWKLLDPDFRPALQLGIEALKLKQKLNSWSSYWHEQLLPGETEE